MLASIDEAVRCRLFQPVADWTTDRFDRSCYWLAGQAALAISGTGMLWVGVLVSDGHAGIVLFILLPLAFCLCSLAGWARAVALERRWRADPSLAPPPPGPAFYRLIWAWFFIEDLVFFAADCSLEAALHALWAATFVAYYWFLACFPRLPRQKRAPAAPALAGAGA